MRQLLQEVQLCGVELVQAIFTLHKDHHLQFGGVEKIVDTSRRFLVIQKELGLCYIPEFSPVILSFLLPLIQSKLEYEQLAVMKALLFVLEWKRESGQNVDGACELNEELLFIFPVSNIVSSPCKVVKQTAIHVLALLEKTVIDILCSPRKEWAMGKLPSVSKPEGIFYRFLQHLWFQDQSSSSRCFYLNYASSEVHAGDGHSGPKSWILLLKDYTLQIIGKRKSSQTLSQSEEMFASEFSLILGAVASVFLMHDNLSNSSVDLLAVIGNMNPELGISLLLVILFYNHAFSSKDKDIDSHGMLLKLLAMIPSLASHSAMIPLIIQTILPMLHADAKEVLYASAVRLICKTWEINDRVFGSLQGLLLPKKFDEFASKEDISISMAASIQDVCRRNPDRGVDLVLSVAACIENQDPYVQSLGLQGLAYLCEADVIDFYTAWDVIAKHVVNYRTNAIVAHSLCLLLRWGAMDTEVYPEAAMNILKILWNIGTSRPDNHVNLWAETRASAFRALTHFEVVHILRSIPDFKGTNVEFLISESDPHVLRAVEEFEARILNDEHVNRRRLVKQKRVPRNKIEKLLDIFPQIILPTGNESRVRELPGAALLCLSFAPTRMNTSGVRKGLEEVNAKFENALLEIASSLQLSRNILIALISLQSWKPFVQRWMKVQLMLLDTKAHSTMLDKTSKAASDMLKTMRRIAEECIPRSAENFPLAIGALCLVLPVSAHAVKSAASKFLLHWLFQYEHEYRQWPAAISLGLISSCLHVTDRKQKYENINALLEVAYNSKSTLVKGACGVGLGFSCQDLLRRIDSEENYASGKETYKMLESELLGKILRAFSWMTCQFSPSSANILQKLCSCIPLGRDDVDPNIPVELVNENCGDLEEDIWGIAGLVLGLGTSISAIYRVGAHDAVLDLKEWIFSHIPRINPSNQKVTINESRDLVLSVGSCLALPIVVAFCQRVELIDDTEVDCLMSGLMELISELISVENYDMLHQNLLMASCIGAGNLLSVVLNCGLHSFKVDNVKDILALFRKSYSSPHPPFVHFGGMLGVVNALGADAGMLVQYFTLTTADVAFDQKESSYVMGPLLSSAALESELASLIQEIFLVAQNSDDHHLRHFAAWAISYLRHSIWFRRSPSEENTMENDGGALKSVSQGLPEDSMAVKLSLWLMHLNPGMGKTLHINTVTSVMRCLSKAPRLPTLDWGATIRRCMRYEEQFAKLLAPGASFKKGILREECVLFSICHANEFDSLLSFLDELSDLSRFRTLELDLQSCMLSHLSDLVKIFSVSRLEKLFEDMSSFLFWLVSSDNYSPEEKSSLRVSCWKGLCLCLDTTPLDTQDYISRMENCMEVLFSLLPAASMMEAHDGISVEWFEAVRCLGKARQSWLLDVLQTSEANFAQGNGHFFEVEKKILVKAKLVQIDSISLGELGKLKAYVLNTRSPLIWNALVEVAATLKHAEESAKRQWLLDTLQISCVTSYPSTALQFLGLLCGNCCKYMPVLIVNGHTVLSDLPVTLSSFLLDSSWGVGGLEPVLSSLWTLTERIYDWTMSIACGDHPSSQQPIDRSEDDKAVFLLRVIHHTCVTLKDYLPVEKQLRLANMLVP